AARPPLVVIRTALQDTIGSYCSFCEMPVHVEEGVASKRMRTLNGTPDLSNWDDLLLACDWCRHFRTSDADRLDDYLWPDVDPTFAIGAGSPFIYSLREVSYNLIDAEANLLQTSTQTLSFVAANPALADDRARNTIDLLQLNTPFYNEASNTFNVSNAERLIDRRVHLRTKAWGLAQKAITALRTAIDDGDPSFYASTAALAASLAQAAGFWSVWMTALWEAFGDRKIIRDVLLETDNCDAYEVVGYQTVPDGGSPPWKLFTGTAIDRMTF
ncbi:MAG: hypothetical protein ABIQ65_01015, partial [Thermoanaerobaculia bacterium]